MRVKFMQPREPNTNEIMFIEYIEKTHDKYGLSEKTLSVFLGVSQREVRRMKEMYNNYKFIGYAPQGKIHAVKNEYGKYLYKLITIDSKYCERFINKVNYNLICAAIEKRNSSRILGESQAKGQLTIYDISNMTLEELIAKAEELSDTDYQSKNNESEK